LFALLSDFKARPAAVRPIRIGYVIGQLTYGGAERQLHELVRRINRDEFQCFVYCLSLKTNPFGPLIKASGIELRVVPRRGRFDVSRVCGLARLLRRDRIDIVHSFLFRANGYAWAASTLARVPHLLTTARNCKELGLARDYVNRLAFRGSDRVICNGEAVRSFTARHFKLPLESSVVIYNGVDLDRFASPPLSAPLEERGKEKLVITVGRLVAQKDLRLFIDAAKLLLAKFGNVRFTIVGDGPGRPGLTRYAVDQGIGEKVSFLGERDDVPQLLAGADVFWLTSAWEGLPNVVLEAMACGKPVVARDVGACGELIHDNETGFLVSSRDPKAFAGYTLALLNDPARAHAMGLTARSLAEERFSVAAMVQSTEALYRSIRERFPGKVARDLRDKRRWVRARP